MAARPDFEALRSEVDEAATRLLTAAGRVPEEMKPAIVQILANLVTALTMIGDRAARQRLATGIAEALPGTVESVLEDERAEFARAGRC